MTSQVVFFLRRISYVFPLLEAKENRIRKSPPKMLGMIAEIVLQRSFTLRVGSSFDYIRFLPDYIL